MTYYPFVEDISFFIVIVILGVVVFYIFVSFI
jgi:hypothetical protein